MIPAVLETALDSTRPGFARAIVSRDVRGFDGSRVLIPRGSRLIGEYRSEAAPGQKRALVIWSRLIRPDGVTIAIASPAGDPLGRGGIRARVNSHFFERFAGAILQSALDIGVNLASTAGGGTVVVLPGTVQQSGVGQIVQPASHADPDRAPGYQHLHIRRPRPRFHRGREPAMSLVAVAGAKEGEGVYLRSYLAP